MNFTGKSFIFCEKVSCYSFALPLRIGQTLRKQYSPSAASRPMLAQSLPMSPLCCAITELPTSMPRVALVPGGTCRRRGPFQQNYFIRPLRVQCLCRVCRCLRDAVSYSYFSQSIFILLQTFFSPLQPFHYLSLTSTSRDSPLSPTSPLFFLLSLGAMGIPLKRYFGIPNGGETTGYPKKTF